jgi:hypothetical protein
MNKQSQWLFEAPPRTPSPPKTSSPKARIVWGSITRILVVPFRRNFTDFRQEVRKALGKHITFRSDRGAYLDSLLNSEPTFPKTIQTQHSSMQLAKPPMAEFTPIEVPATFYYTPGFKRVTRITFP